MFALEKLVQYTFNTNRHFLYLFQSKSPLVFQWLLLWKICRNTRLKTALFSQVALDRRLILFIILMLKFRKEEKLNCCCEKLKYTLTHMDPGAATLSIMSLHIIPSGVAESLPIPSGKSRYTVSVHSMVNIKPVYTSPSNNTLFDSG